MRRMYNCTSFVGMFMLVPCSEDSLAMLFVYCVFIRKQWSYYYFKRKQFNTQFIVEKLQCRGAESRRNNKPSGILQISRNNRCQIQINTIELSFCLCIKYMYVWRKRKTSKENVFLFELKVERKTLISSH